jgi:hypothetical protein
MVERTETAVTADVALRAALPTLIVVAGLLGLEVAYGAAVADAILYAAYELGFVLIPGWVAYRALSSRPGGALRNLAIGWALGYVFETLAFMLTAATDTRDLFFAYPLLVGGAALVALLRRTPDRGPRGGPALPRGFGLALSIVCLVAATYVALPLFSEPLPGSEEVRYFQDHPWHLSLAADAKHHWPIQDPNVSGEPLPYHYFVHVHLAAASQVTGLDLPLVYFRLFAVPLVVHFVLLVVVAGQSLARSSWVGLIAACLALFVGQVTLDFTTAWSQFPSFLGVFFTFLITSPSFLYGLVLLTSLIVLIGERITDRSGAGRVGDWLLIALFAIGASNAKVAILPMMLVALALYAGWAWVVWRRIPRTIWLSVAPLLLAGGALYVLEYMGRSSGLGLDLSAGVDFFNGMPAVALIKAELADALPSLPAKSIVLSTGAILFGAVGLFGAQLAGLVWIAHRRGRHLDAAQVWLLSLFGAGLLGILTLRSPGTANQMYFLAYGLVPACILSAEGMRIAWSSRPSVSDRAVRLAALAIGFLVLLVGLIVAPVALDFFSGPNASAHTYMFLYGGLLLALALLYLTARRWIGGGRWAAVALLSGALLVIGLLDTPINKLEPSLSNPGAGTQSGRRITPELYGAMSWIRDNTPSDSVIAVNNGEALEFDYSAFAERRTFFGGWGYSLRSRESGYAAVAKALILRTAGGAGADLFPTRLAMNNAVFKRGDPGAAATLADQYRVQYLLADEVNGYPVDEQALSRFGQTVYRAPGVTVFRLR